MENGFLIPLSIVYFLLSPLAVYAETSGASFLRIGDGAKPLALGGAYTAYSGSVDSLYYNPAGLATLDGQELSLSYSDWLGGTTFNVLSYGHRTSLGTLGVSALRLGGEQEGRDANRLKTGDFTTEDIAALLSYSQSMGSHLAAGANFKYLRSRIDSDSASTIAVDVGAIGRTPGFPMSLGVSVLNMGSGLRFIDQVDRLPLTVSFGALFQPITPLGLSLDYTHEPHDRHHEISAGTQYAWGPFDFRVGYREPLNGGNDGLGMADRVRGGLGIRISRYRADYSLASFGELGLTQRFTLSILFGQEPKNLRPHAREKESESLTTSLFRPRAPQLLPRASRVA